MKDIALKTQSAGKKNKQTANSVARGRRTQDGNLNSEHSGRPENTSQGFEGTGEKGRGQHVKKQQPHVQRCGGEPSKIWELEADIWVGKDRHGVCMGRNRK